MNYRGTYIGVDLSLRAAAPDHGEAQLAALLEKLELPKEMLEKADGYLAYMPPVVFLAGQVFNISRNHQLPERPEWKVPQDPWWVFLPVVEPVSTMWLCHWSFQYRAEADRALDTLFNAFVRFDTQLKETMEELGLK